MALALSGVPPPLKPKKPFGETVIVLPVDAFTVFILDVTASRAINIDIERAIATAKMTTTPTARIEFLKALRMPRRTAFTTLSSQRLVLIVSALLEEVCKLR